MVGDFSNFSWLSDRPARQVHVSDWAVEAFGSHNALFVPQRAIRFLEEAIELYQACDGDRAMAHKLLDFVFDRPVGTISNELGGVGVTVLALAQAAGLSAEEEEIREVMRVMSKPREQFRSRNAAKNAAGFLAQPAVKPYKGRIKNWWRSPLPDGRYLIRGEFVDHPDFAGEFGHTSYVVNSVPVTSMNREGVRFHIETRNSRYDLLGGEYRVPDGDKVDYSPEDPA